MGPKEGEKRAPIKKKRGYYRMEKKTKGTEYTSSPGNAIDYKNSKTSYLCYLQKWLSNKIPQRTKVQQCTKVQFVSLQSGEFNTVEVRYLFLKTGNSHLCAMLQSKNEMDLI